VRDPLGRASIGSHFFPEEKEVFFLREVERPFFRQGGPPFPLEEESFFFDYSFDVRDLFSQSPPPPDPKADFLGKGGSFTRLLSLEEGAFPGRFEASEKRVPFFREGFP